MTAIDTIRAKRREMMEPPAKVGFDATIRILHAMVIENRLTNTGLLVDMNAPHGDLWYRAEQVWGKGNVPCDVADAIAEYEGADE